MSTTAAVRALSLTLFFSASAAAQVATPADTAGGDGSALLQRSAASLSVVQSRPHGAFGQHVGLGYGLDGAWLLRLDSRGIWSLRASAGVLRYGDESRRAAFSETVGGRVMVDVTTSNYIIPMSLGPQVSWPTGPVRPYANAGIGALGFLTQSDVRGTGDLVATATTTNHSSLVATWSVGGGVLVPISIGRKDVQLDLGVQYFGGGTTRYLAPGSIVDLPGTQIAVSPLESTTHMMVVRFGLRVQP